ncbi:hypothetical protein CF327_g3364 [Tilletia walkeri]|uniref:Protein kinase domain-containing protein n=1 Tax=Tilletia walkeri TaxID=117179 RepID=A0A8X7T764_9BASI|nr:hypothetical protein CF327_g3364 [Tilletia walkeri]KAE8271406.1 hypothetical protein A4X09_0g921 [Tilletia walkeri]
MTSTMSTSAFTSPFNTLGQKGKAAASASGDANTNESTGSRLSSALGTSNWRAAQHRGSVMDEYPMYSCNAEDYVLGREIGFGASSVVYEAKFKPLGARVAVKVIELEAFGRDTDELRRETQLMSLSKHPNVLRVRGCYLVGSKLNIATRLMAAGSMLDIMRFSHPDGFDEIVVATVLRQALQGLHYLHQNDWLHRDLKAANILVDDDGTVLLGDFGVGVWLGESSAKVEGSADTDHDSGGRKSFVGTPAWMAPEVVERKHYGVKADIWSFGITALELCHGRAPHARFAPVKALMKTLSDEPPQLDREGGAHKYSKAMEDFVRVCLQKDPSKRPTAEKLLQHAVFKQARGPKFLVNAILSGLPPLSDRQERRRKVSISSMRTTQSWDFGSVGAGSGRWTPGTHTADRTDPFLGFSGIFGTAASPRGSVRSSKIISFDGQHAIAVTPSHSHAQLGGSLYVEHTSIEQRSRSQSAAGLANRRSRNRSSDSGFVTSGTQGTSGSVGASGGLRAMAMHQLEHQRRSISREPSIDGNLALVGDRQNGVSDGGKSAAGAAGAKDANGATGVKALEPIGEQKSPAALLPETSTSQVPGLELPPPSPFVGDKDDGGLQPSPDMGLPARWNEASNVSEPSSRAVSSSTTTSKTTTASSATTVTTDLSTSVPAISHNQKPRNLTASESPSLPFTPEGEAGDSAPRRVASRSSQTSTSQAGSDRGAPSAAQPSSFFLNRIRSRSSRPNSRNGSVPPPHLSSSPDALVALSSPLSRQGGSSTDSEQGGKAGQSPDEGKGHRRNDSVLGKLFGRNKKDGGKR